MAAIANAYVERITEITHTGDLNFSDVVTIPASSFVANGVYFIIATGEFNGDWSQSNGEVRLVHGSTPTVFTGSLITFDIASTLAADKLLWGPYVTEFTQPATAEDVKVQMRVKSLTTNTIRGNNITIWAIRRDSDLVENTDFKYAEVTSPTQHTTTMAARASITWTPADNNHDWLVICCESIDINSAGVNFEIQIDRDSGAETAGFFGREGERVDDVLLLGTFWPFTLTDSEHTLALHSRDDATGTNDHEYSAILALRLDRFEDHTIFTNTGAIDGLGDDVFGEIGAMDITPATAGDIVLMARANVTEFAANDESTIRIEIGGTDTLGKGGDSENGTWAAKAFDTTDRSPHFCLARENVAASLQDVDIDGKLHEGTAGQQDFVNRAGVVFSMELANGAPADVEGMVIGGKLLRGGLLKSGLLVR